MLPSLRTAMRVAARTSHIARPSLRKTATQTRTLSILAPTARRPLLPSSSLPSISTPTASPSPTSGATALPCASMPTTLMQVRGVKRNTFNPSHLVRKRRHGFLARARSKKGVLVLKRRRLKGRKALSH